MNAPVLRILLAEDTELVAEAFEALLNFEPDLEVVARVSRGDQILAAVEATGPHVAVLDIDLPGTSGIDAAEAIHRLHPECRVLLLTALPGVGHLHRALAVGAAGYLLKSTSAQRLIDAIHTVVAGGTVVDPGLAVDALRLGPSPLSERETEILRCVDRGIGTDEIARELFLTEGTVRNYLSNAMTKLDAGDRHDAVRRARREGWL